MSLNTRYTIAPKVSWREHAGKLILIDMGSGECFELNETGTEIWKGIERGDSSLAIAIALAENHQLTTDVARQHIDQLGTQLIERRLVTASVEGPP
jgi:Coenzyme PQQ synthesis protein D (PqqD)